MKTPRSRCVGHASLSLATFLLLSGGLALAQASPAWITNQQQEGIRQRLRKGFPDGWTITRTSLNRAPDDWYTLDKRSFEIDGRTAGHAFQIWFLPRDWIGIRQPGTDRLRPIYWEGILMDADFKTITSTEEVSVHSLLQQLGMNTPSLVNGGWKQAQTIFKDRLPEVDKQAQQLVDRFCKDTPCKEEAAYSLIVLGVPALSHTLDCAEHARGKAQEFCVSALGYWKGRDSIRVLSGVITEPSTSGRVQNYAAIALDFIANASAGPALTQSLQTVSNAEAAAHVAEALGRIRYGLAAPQLLVRMEQEPNRAYQVLYARALASLHYRPAIPAIEKLCETTKFSGDWLLPKQQDTYLGWLPEIALMRLKEPWGTESNGIRLLLLPPGRIVLPGPVGVVAVIENVDDQDLDILGTTGHVIVDGKEYAHRDSVIADGNITLRVDDVYARMIDLSGLITGAGLHHVEYRLGTAKSNSLTLSNQSTERRSLSEN